MGFLLHVIFQNQGILPGEVMGVRSSTEKVTAGERAFILASTRKALEEGYTPVKIGNFPKSKGGAGK